MKNLLKNKIYLSMIIGGFVALLSTISLLIVNTRTYFTIILILNIFVNFLITSFILLVKDEIATHNRFKNISLYLFITLSLLILDELIIKWKWDFNIYSNLMYIQNIQLYLSIYSIFVLIMICMSIYAVLKVKCSNNKTSIRQKSSKR